MPQAETFLFRVALPAGARLPIGDVYLRSDDGAKKQAELGTGETLDLSKMDLASVAQSARRGMLAGMVESGSVVKVLAEVSEKVFDTLQAELEKWPVQRKDGRYAHATEVVSIEPGLMVAVGGAGTQTGQQMLPVAGAQDKPPVPDANQVSQTSDFGMPQAGAQDHNPAPQAGAGEGEAQETPVSWKDGKTLPEQEAFIKVSTDKVFLTAVMTDKNETKKMQRLAKSRLAELE